MNPRGGYSRPYAESMPSRVNGQLVTFTGFSLLIADQNDLGPLLT